MRCGSCVWRRTFTCFVAEESAFDTLHHRSTETTSHCLFPTKGTTEDSHQHVWYAMQVERHDAYGNQKVGHSHKRHDGRAHFGYTVYAPEYY